MISRVLTLILICLFVAKAQHGPSPPAPILHDDAHKGGEPQPPAPPPSDCSTVRCPSGTICKMIEEPCQQSLCPGPLPECVREAPAPPQAPTTTAPHKTPSTSPSPPPASRTTSTTPAPTTKKTTPRAPSIPPTKTSSSASCSSVTCAEGTVCRMVEIQCKSSDCPKAQPMCIARAPPQLRCPKNESWRNCSTKCEPTCEDMTPKCTRDCDRPKCQCDPGFFRNRSGVCVDPSQC
ncbi:trypsin Inhibitor like cysteine rich domain protein [Ancylostoma caninum]|uniref:Trypsin Inhibitor like cysteine rich domain protein n=1 Tax=Ancylostoma caninum TaxID=29170 RepID=A0A368FYE2_ANCCA|nr:trypsin Inhibitor like cysteine rich domain protein [Ancylostoma caninum]